MFVKTLDVSNYTFFFVLKIIKFHKILCFSIIWSEMVVQMGSVHLHNSRHCNWNLWLFKELFWYVPELSLKNVTLKLTVTNAKIDRQTTWKEYFLWKRSSQTTKEFQAHTSTRILEMGATFIWSDSWKFVQVQNQRV